MGTREQKLRQRERRKAENAAAIDALRQIGARCGNCKHADPDMTCSLHSSFGVDAKINASGLCRDWKGK